MICVRVCVCVSLFFFFFFFFWGGGGGVTVVKCEQVQSVNQRVSTKTLSHIHTHRQYAQWVYTPSSLSVMQMLHMVKSRHKNVQSIQIEYSISQLQVLRTFLSE